MLTFSRYKSSLLDEFETHVVLVKNSWDYLLSLAFLLLWPGCFPASREKGIMGPALPVLPLIWLFMGTAILILESCFLCAVLFLEFDLASQLALNRHHVAQIKILPVCKSAQDKCEELSR